MFPSLYEIRRSTMPLTAIVREVSSSINDCELSFHDRQPIDVARAIAQHQAYQDCLAELEVRIVSLPAEAGLPDAVFVEDPAVVVDEMAVISNMGAPSRRPEARSWRMRSRITGRLSFWPTLPRWTAEMSCASIARSSWVYRDAQIVMALSSWRNCWNPAVITSKPLA